MQNQRLVELSPTEKYYYYASLLGDMNALSISIINIDDNEVQLNDGIIKEAIYYMCKRHPLLRAKLYKDENTKKHYFSDDYEKKLINFEETVFERSRVNDRNEFISECEKFNSIIFNYSNNCLLWRLKVVEFKEDLKHKLGLILVLGLYITDGVNISALSIDLLNIINSLLQNKQCIEMNEHFELLDNTEKIIETHGLLTPEIKDKFEKADANKEEIKFLFPKEFKNQDDHGMKINLLALDIELSNLLANCAKSKGVKLTGLFESALFYALNDLYKENQIEMPKNLTTFVPVNLRFRAKPNIDFSRTRSCVGGFNIDLKYPTFGKYEDIWNDAKYINDLIHLKIENSDMISMFIDGTFKQIESIFNESTSFQETVTILNQETNEDVVLSSIGKYVADKKPVLEGPLKLEESYFGDSLAADFTFFPSFVLHISFINERIMFQLSTNKHRFYSGHADRFMTLFEQQLRKCVS